MIIGNFKTAGDGFTGFINTLTFSAEVVFEPAKKKTDKSPDYYVTTTGNTDIGVAWAKVSPQGTHYISVSLDDPSLPAPIYCALVKTGSEHGYTLVWDRKRPRD